MKLHTDGYYRTENQEWVDWHAGHKFEGIIYSVLLFLNDSQVISYITDKPVLNMEELRNSHVGHYKQEEDTIGIWSDIGKFADSYFIYVIMSSEHIVSEKGRIYYFVPFT